MTVSELETLGEVVDVLRHTLIREFSAQRNPPFKEINAYVHNFSASIDVLCWLGPQRYKFWQYHGSQGLRCLAG